MREGSPLIWETWNEGRPLIGDRRACTRVTVEHAWSLKAEANPGKWDPDRCPVHWWQHADNDQVELEIPQENIKTVSIDRSIDNDAAQCDISLLNTLPEYNSPGPIRKSPGVFGEPGGLGFDYGEHGDARSRWGHVRNGWYRTLLPGALLRTYQGYGGHDKTLAQAIADGNLILTGQWIVDDVSPSHAGNLDIVARDMASLLVDQIAYPPLLPKAWYPCRFFRWITEFRRLTKPVEPLPPEHTIVKRIRYRDSSADRWYGCVDTETEALTRRGWARFDEIKPDDELLGIDPSTGCTEWQPVLDLNHYDVEDETLLHVKAVGFDALTTLNHRWLFRRAPQPARLGRAALAGEEWRWTMSRNLNSGDRIPRNAPYGAAPETAVHPDAFVELVGWFWTEGTRSASGDVTIYQSREVNAANCDRIERCLEAELGAPGIMCKSGPRCRADHRHPGWSMGDYGKGVHYRVTRTFGARLASSAPSRVLSPEFLLELTQSQLELLYRVSMLGDGKTESSLSQASEDRIRAFEMLCVLTGRKFLTSAKSDGMHVTSMVQPGRNGGSTSYVHRRAHRELVTYSGTVWCPTVKHGNWLARRNGKPFITGNSNANVHGHRGSDSVDQNPASFALSVGNSHPSRPFTCDWMEYDVGEEINAIWLHPWGGNYEVYISVMEDGRWLGDQTIPYDHAPLIGNQPTVVDTGADIRFVSKGGIGWEQPTRFQLPRMYRAERLRVTFRNHTKSQWGPWYYRCGIREINAEIHTGGASGSTWSGTGAVMNSIPSAPVWVDLAATTDGDGYYALHSTGQVEEFGTATKYGQPYGEPLMATKTAAQSIVPVVDGAGDDAGYYVLAGNGKVFTYGAAAYFSDGSGNPDASHTGTRSAVALCLTHTGLGYWIVTRDGWIFNYGDAPPYTRAAGQFGAACSHPSAYGLWLYDEVGPVTVRGSATLYARVGGLPLPAEFGSPPQTCPGLIGSGIVATPTGLGYITVEEFGSIEVFGDAVNLGATSGFVPPPYPPGNVAAPKEPRVNAIAVAPIVGGTIMGYATLAYDGRIFPQKDFPVYGQPSDGEAEVKKPGNYKDYSDIVYAFLLWSGFFLQNDSADKQSKKPLLNGNIESTGAYAEDALEEDFFQNKPIIDIINSIKEIMGYLFWVDDEGKARFESPNWFKAGNFWSDGPNDGTYTDQIPVIDERVNMTEYTASTTKRHSRSKIQVGTDDPLYELEGTLSYTHVPNDTYLRGMMVPASMAVPMHGISVAEMKNIAQLIGLHIWLARRTGSVSCLANPAIGINDQVRILERATSEVYIHYVRGSNTTHDLKSGTYIMNLTTHWLGDRDDWVIHVDPQSGDVKYAYEPLVMPPGEEEEDPILLVRGDIERYELSPEAYQRIRSRRPGPAAAETDPKADALAQVNDIDEPDGDDGAAAI